MHEKEYVYILRLVQHWLLSCIRSYPRVGTPLCLKTDKLGSKSDLAASLYRILRFGETLNLPKLGFLCYNIWVYYIGHGGVNESLTACWEFRRLLIPCLLSSPRSPRPMSLLQRFQWPTLPAPVLAIWSSKSKQIPSQNTAHCFYWLHAETTSAQHHGPSLVWFNLPFLCLNILFLTLFCPSQSLVSGISTALLPMGDILGYFMPWLRCIVHNP